MDSPATTTSPANAYWGINESIKYGSTTILSTTAGIVDTGTTLILIATGERAVSPDGAHELMSLAQTHSTGTNPRPVPPSTAVQAC